MVDPKTHKLATVLFALAMAAVVVVEVSGLVRNGSPFPSAKISWDGFFSGDDARVLESWLKDNSTVAAVVRPTYNEILFSLVGASAPKVVVGKTMLFHKDRVDLKDAPFWAARRSRLVESVKDAHEALAGEGIDLVVAMVPDRIRIYPEEASDIGFIGSAKESYYDDAIADLRAAGVDAFDLVELFRRERDKSGSRENLFRRDDTHWNARGADAAAEALARHLESRGIERGPWRPERRLETEEYVGNLLNLTGWRPESELYRAFEDPRKIWVLTSPDGKELPAVPWDTDIVVAADSFGLQHIAGLTGYYLGRPVADITQVAKGAYYSIFRLLHEVRRGWRPRMVVWVFEESATYIASLDITKGLFKETQVDAKQGVVTRVLPIESIRPARGIDGKLEGGQWRLTSRTKYFELEIDRAVCTGERLALHLLPERRTGRSTIVSLLDEGDRRRLKNDLKTEFLFTLDGSRPPGWHRLELPVPPGEGRLILAMLAPDVGLAWQIRDVCSVHTADAVPATSAVAPWKPKSFEALTPRTDGRFERSGNASTLEAQSLGGRSVLSATVERTTRMVFEPPIADGMAAIQVGLGALAARTGVDGRVVISSGIECAGEVVELYQREIIVRTGADVALPYILELPPNLAGNARLFVEVNIPEHLVGAVRAGVAFGAD